MAPRRPFPTSTEPDEITTTWGRLCRDRSSSVARDFVSKLGSIIWSVADQLRGPYRPNQYGTVILPFTILRRLDSILESARATVRELAARHDNPNGSRSRSPRPPAARSYNTSNYSFANLLADADGRQPSPRPSSTTKAPTTPWPTTSSATALQINGVILALADAFYEAAIDEPANA